MFDRVHWYLFAAVEQGDAQTTLLSVVAKAPFPPLTVLPDLPKKTLSSQRLLGGGSVIHTDL